MNIEEIYKLPKQDGLNKEDRSLIKGTIFHERNAAREVIIAAGDDPTRDGLLDTPVRYIKFLKEFTNPPPFEFTTFTEEGADEMVTVINIPFYSLCEHHLAPFFGVGHIAYIPMKGKIVGLSKLPRVLDMFSRRLQNQERITYQVANYINEHLWPKGVGVVLKARHMCMEMRGVEKPGAETITSKMIGVFKDQVNTRQEFLNLLK